MRDLRKEAAAFIPAAVQRKLVTSTSTTAAATTTTTTNKTTDAPEAAAGGAAGIHMLNAAPQIGVPVHTTVDQEYEQFRREMEVDVAGGGRDGKYSDQDNDEDDDEHGAQHDMEI